MLHCGKVAFLTFCVIGLLCTRAARAGEIRTNAYLFFNPGTVWDYQDTQGTSHRRIVKPVREISVVQQSGKSQTMGFLPLVSLSGGAEEIARSNDIRGNEDNSFTQFYLRTSRGLLRSSRLGDGAQEFWPQAFLVLPAVLTPGAQWDGQAEGARISFRFEGLKKITVPAGTFDDCLSISYQHGMEPSGQGEIDYCAGMGEVRVVEGDYRRDLIRFKAGQGALPESALVDEALTADLLRRLPQAETVSPVLPAQQVPLSLLDDLGLRGRWAWLVTLLLPTGLVAWLLIHRRKKGNAPKPLELSAEAQEELRKLMLLRDAPGLQAARNRLLEMVKVHPEYADLHFHLGILHEEQGDLDAARASLQKATEINPQYIEALLSLAKLKHRQEDLQGAATTFDQVLLLRPSFADIHNTQGEILMKLGEEERARFHFTKALEINPHFERARKNLQARSSRAS